MPYVPVNTLSADTGTALCQGRVPVPGHDPDVVVCVAMTQMSVHANCIVHSLFPGGLVVRIRRSHRRGPGSIPGGCDTDT
ncbi:hypothetical protein JZ751_015584 [Albula glossodonta]|uniref:Uncharacterized protein n=1 Tax=Albula glossodonta TaxID=121402 RepID=A0A8T2NZ82_9TELE|nr:hypothetical protein JZ751_015584 [Albula glossodonta]